MQILPEFNHPIIIDSLTAPMIIKYCWMFDASLIDFVLNPIQYLEETTGASVKIRINNTEFWVPATWNILITDLETLQIDTVAVTSCANIKYIAYSFSPVETNLRTLDIKVVDYSDNKVLVHPMIGKGMAMVHPVGPASMLKVDCNQLSVVIGPHDLYKYIGGKVVGDILSY